MVGSILFSRDGDIVHGVISFKNKAPDLNSMSYIQSYITTIEPKAFSSLKYYDAQSYSMVIGKNITEIADDAFEGVEDRMTLAVYDNTYGLQYAESHNIKYYIIDKAPETIEDDGLTFIVDKENKYVSLKSVKTEAVKNGRLKLPKTVKYENEDYTLTKILKDAIKSDELYNLIEEIEIPSDVKVIENNAIYVKAKKIKILSKDVSIGGLGFDPNVLKANNSVIYAYSATNAATYALSHQIPYRPIKLVNDIIFAYDDNDKTADLVRIYATGADEQGNVFLDEKIDGYTIKSFNSYTVDSKNIKYLEILSEIDGIDDLAFKNVENNITLGVLKDSICEQFAKDKNIKYLLYGEDKYEIEEDGTLSVYTYKEEVEIPEKVNDITVKKIKLVSCIKEDGNVKKIEFPKTVNKILDNSCSNLKLEEVIIPGWKTSVEKNTFQYSEDIPLTIKGYVGSNIWRYRKLHMDKKQTKFESLEDDNGLKWGYENYDFDNTSDFFTDSDYDNGNPDSKYYKRLANNLRTASDRYRNKNNNKNNWIGSCFGQAITTILFKDKVLNVNNWQLNGTADNQYDLIDVRDNHDLKNMINIYHTLQHQLKVSNGMNVLNTEDKSLKGVYKSVKNYYKSNSDEFLELDRWWACV